ncbi:glycoside hydrolase family 3 C-terminal domain-containing protein [Phocaeicola coprocola]|uniref:glycoside hydrolase family 3 C-terminal domain-containing protein n=1 Tax=Phocaeicola coprocola TaxID=310298 RepID=UPI00195C0B16|nr:glycoside hydrolase family 3 C-terminal domain-containing protein [Phocaeicola coprocola]MBM6712568.1 beta-glucosidase [Phocaeicola coprocola]
MVGIGVAALCMVTPTVQAQVKLNANNIDEVIGEMTLEEKVHMVIGCGMSMGDGAKFPGTAGRTYDIPRLGIPSVYLADGPHRLAMSVKRDFDSRFYYATEFPSGTTVAATFDPNAAYQVGAALGEEVKDYGMDVLLAPGANLMRNALCGRNHEYYSEDPVVTGKMAAGYIKGVQSQGVGTCLKHFAVNNQETNRNNNDSRVAQRPLRELYLKGFEIAVKESQPWSIMTSYNKVNGKYTCEDIDLTENILRDEWGFKGVVMSDWNAGTDAVTSMKAGNDMLQPGQERQYKAILEAVQNGTLDEAILNRNVKRILELVVKCHTFENYKYANETDLKAHAIIDRTIGAEGIVLLDNRSVLPLTANVKTIALYGTTSYDMVPAGMGFGSTGVGYYCVSLVEGMRNAGYTVDADLIKKYKKHLFDEQKRLYPNGKPPFSLTPLKRAEEFVPTSDELSAQVKNNDVAIITLGRTSGEASDRRVEEFYLKENESALIKQVAEAYHAAGKKVIVILNICSPVETASWKNMVDAVICAFQPGQEVGNCVADVLTGKVNPSGHLPMTFAIKYGDAPSDSNFPYDYEFKMPSFAMGSGMNFESKEKEEKPKEAVRNVDFTDYEEGIYVGYRYFETFDKEVSYPFGHGLSYTTFSFEIVSSDINGDNCEMKVAVKNTGNCAGKESVQVYVKAPAGGLEKPAKELKAFAKTKLLQPGESEVVTLSWKLMDMASLNEKSSSWELPKGTYQWMVGASSADVRCTVIQKVSKAQKVKVHNAMIPPYKIAQHDMVKR